MALRGDGQGFGEQLGRIEAGEAQTRSEVAFAVGK